jgi:hypothetical protein
MYCYLSSLAQTTYQATRDLADIAARRKHLSTALVGKKGARQMFLRHSIRSDFS